jgi:hypothetical protein
VDEEPGLIVNVQKGGLPAVLHKLYHGPRQNRKEIWTQALFEIILRYMGVAVVVQLSSFVQFWNQKNILSELLHQFNIKLGCFL